MRQNGGRTAQRYLEIRSEDLAIHRNIFRQAVEDEIKIDLSGHRYIELGRHRNSLGSEFPAPACALNKNGRAEFRIITIIYSCDAILIAAPG